MSPCFPRCLDFLTSSCGLATFGLSSRRRVGTHQARDTPKAPWRSSPPRLDSTNRTARVPAIKRASVKLPGTTNRATDSNQALANKHLTVKLEATVRVATTNSLLQPLSQIKCNPPPPQCHVDVLIVPDLHVPSLQLESIHKKWHSYRYWEISVESDGGFKYLWIMVSQCSNINMVIWVLIVTMGKLRFTKYLCGDRHFFKCCTEMVKPVNTHKLCFACSLSIPAVCGRLSQSKPRSSRMNLVAFGWEVHVPLADC